ncbi:hypothetical protein Vadar_016090 [Vaccinium darrowii]|uniref:Uncharacterized protein n=1 Tax=Vaccinium darrowii TaxID=229202 RepID=A0ACB7X139_9ERIC|nr:hypothetical protein Vadar_016090 [Vaccinium darrowii]
MTAANPPQIRGRKTRIKSLGSRKFSVFIFWVLLIFSHLNPSSSHYIPLSDRNRSPPPTRKTRFFNNDVNAGSFHAAQNSTSDHGSVGGGKNGDCDGNSYKDDERVVHTGPNPLHN